PIHSLLITHTCAYVMLASSSLVLPLPPSIRLFFFFFFHDTATTEIYTLSLHDALPICSSGGAGRTSGQVQGLDSGRPRGAGHATDRKSTRLNSSHVKISYAVFCLKKKKQQESEAR